jgi:hypothetical protein
MNDFSADVLSLHKIEVDLHNGGAIDTPTHIAIQRVFLQVDGYEHQLDALISAQAAAVTVQAKVDSLKTALDGIASATAQLSPATRTQISNAVQLAEQVLTNVLAAIPATVGQLRHDYFDSTNQPITEARFGSIDNRSTGRGGRHHGAQDLQPSEVGQLGRGSTARRFDRSSRG